MRWLEAEDGSLVNLERCWGIVVRTVETGAGNELSTLAAFTGQLHVILASGTPARCAALLSNLKREFPEAIWRVGTPPSAMQPPAWDDDGGRRGD